MIEQLTALRTHLQADAALTAWFASTYPGRTVRHFIGYKKPANAHDYPAICYIPVRDELGGQPFDRLTVALIASIHAPGIDDDIFDGAAHSAALSERIVASLRAGTSPFNLDGDQVRVITDLGLGHPFYHTELQFELISWR